MPYKVDLKNLETFKAGGESYWYLDYKDEKYTLVCKLQFCNGGDLEFREEFSEEESAIILAEAEQVIKCAKEYKEYFPATKGLEYYVEYTDHALDF